MDASSSNNDQVESINMEIQKLKQEISKLQQDIINSTLEETHNINTVDEYLQKIQKVCFERKSSTITSSRDQVIEVKRLLSNQCIKTCIVGALGSGKTSWLNKLIKVNLLPAGCAGNHVTKCVMEVIHGNEFQVQIFFVSEDLFKDRIKLMKNQEEKQKISFVQRTTETKKFDSLQELSDFITKFNKNLKDSEILLVEKIVVSLPEMIENIIILDTPGLGSLNNNEPFMILASEAAKSSDTVLYFGESNSVASDNDVQFHPPSFKFMCGGVNFNTSETKFETFLSTWKEISTLEDQFKDMVSIEFNYLHQKDNLPKENIGNHQLLVDIKEFCTSLMNNFGTIIIPHNDSENFELCDELARASFDYQLKKEICKKLLLTTIQIRDQLMSLIPYLNKANKSIGNENEEYLKRLEILLMNKMDSLINSFKIIVNSEPLEEGINLNSVFNIFKRMISSISKKEFLKIVNDYLEEDNKFVQNENSSKKRVKNPETISKKKKKENYMIRKSVEYLIDSCKKFIESKSKVVEWKHFSSSSETEMKKKLDIDIKDISDHLKTIFNPNNKHRFVLSEQIKEKLDNIFKTYQSKVYYEYEYEIGTCYQIPKKLQGKLVPPIKDIGDYDDYARANMITYRDMCYTNSIKTHSLSEISEIIIQNSPESNSINSPQEGELPLIGAQSSHHIDNDLISTIIIDQDSKSVVFRDPPQIENLEEFQTFYKDFAIQTRIHPVFIIAPHGKRENVIPNLLVTSLHKECITNGISHLVFVVVLKNHVGYYKTLIRGKKNYHIIAIDNPAKNLNLSFLFLETICLLLSSKHFNFKIVTILNEDVGKIYEYLPKLKKICSEKLTTLRYLRFIESLVYHEVSLKETELEERLVKLFDKEFVNNMFDTNNSDIVLKGCKHHANNPSDLINRLRIIDHDHNKDYERKFINAMFSQGVGKFSLKSKTEDNRLHNIDKTNYILGHCHEDVTTYFIPAMENLYPLSDDTIFNKINRERTSIERLDPIHTAPFRATMLFNGVASYHCFSFSYTKSLNEDTEIEHDYGSDSSNEATSRQQRPRKLHKRSNQ